VKTRGDEARHVFLFGSRTGACNPDVQLSDVLLDADFDDASLAFPEEREDPVLEPTLAPPELLPMLKHLVRIEFAVPTGGGYEMRYCSGLLLDANTVLTARHCVAPVEGASCLDDPRRCKSYSVDIGFTKGPGAPPHAMLTLPVMEARAPLAGTSGARLDFAFLLLPSWPGAALSRLPVQSSTLSSAGASTFLLGYPFGNPAMFSSCQLLDARDGFEFHDCFACGGSSGAPLWTVGWSRARNELAFDVVGIHTRWVRNCLNGRWADDVTPALKTRLGERSGACAGRASSLHAIFCEYCVRAAELDLKICEALAGLLEGDERACN
jgi:hypothetical protein